MSMVKEFLKTGKPQGLPEAPKAKAKGKKSKSGEDKK